MKLKIEIEMDNAAFEVGAGGEAARILRRLANEIDPADSDDLWDFNRSLRDANGNRVGDARVTI